MHNVLELTLPKELRHPLTIGKIKLHKCKARQLMQFTEPGLFERRIVVGIKVVDADDRFPGLQQAARDVETNEPGRASHQNRSYSRHRSIPSGLLARSSLALTSSTTPLPARSSFRISSHPSER